MTLDLTTEAIAKLSPAELISTLQQISPDDPALKDVNIDVIARGIDPKKLGKDDFAALLTASGHARRRWRRPRPRQDGPARTSPASSRAPRRTRSRPSSPMPALRARVLDEVFRRMEVHFRADRAGATRAVVHFHVLEDVYEAIIEDAQVHHQQGRDARGPCHA